MNFGIRAKLLGSFGVMIALAVAVFGAGFWGMTNVASHTDTIVHHDLVEDVSVRELEVLILEQTATYEDFVITEDPQDLEIIAHEIDEVERHFHELNELFGTNEHLLELLHIVEAEYERFLHAGDELIELVQDHASDEEIIHELHILTGEKDLLEEELAHLAHEVEVGIEQGYQEAVAAKNTATGISVGVMIAAAVVGVAIALWIARSIAGGIGQVLVASEAIAEGDLDQKISVKSKDEVGQMADAFGRMIVYLRGMAESADQLAEGDLTSEVKPKSERDALGNAFSKMINNLREIVGSVANTASEVSAASTQLASTSEQTGAATQTLALQAQELAQGSIEQRSVVDETSESVQQLGSAIDQIATGAQKQNTVVDSTRTTISEVADAVNAVATNAQEAAVGSTSAGEAAVRGLEIVEQTVEGMVNINKAVDDVSSKVGELGDQSVEIGKIVGVIDDIAAQTNLLALNAAIEAARAGEQGRGFAVVADEVRQLAERVTQATSEIAGLIDTVQKGVAESIKATEQGTAEVEKGSELANEAGRSLNAIEQAVRTVGSQIETISAAAEEVTASSGEMVRSIEEVSSITEETTAATEQMAASSDQVQRAMGAIRDITSKSGESIEQSSASTEELSAQVEEVVASSGSLGEMAGVLDQTVARFKLESQLVTEEDSDDEAEEQIAA